MTKFNHYPESAEDAWKIPFSSHASFYHVNESVQKWRSRFPQAIDSSIFNDLMLFYLMATRKYLDHRHHNHLFRLILTLYNMRTKLLQATTFFPQQRYFEIRWIPTALLYPFSSKPVMGCLIGFNALDKYEVFDEENILLVLQKYLPELKLVKESFYTHPSPHKNLKFFYFEIEKMQSIPFSLDEQSLFKKSMKEKIKNCIQKLSPAIYMSHNEEEIYKNILVLSQEIQSLQDLPQAYITFDQQTGKEIIFRVLLVYISPFHHFSLKDCFISSQFVSQQVITVRHLEEHPVEAHIFTLHFARDVSLLRSDGSLDFYAARQKVAYLITKAIGEFRDFNGGIIITQQKLLQNFKEIFSDHASKDPELLESFFYAIIPLEKQAVLQPSILSNLFNYFLENKKHKIVDKNDYIFKIYHHEKSIYIVVHSRSSSLIETTQTFFQEHASKIHDVAYNSVQTAEGYFFNAVLAEEEYVPVFIQTLQEALKKLHQQIKDCQILRIALGQKIVSLDPRIGGEAISGYILRTLFEGLTRFNQKGEIENALAESIEVSSNMRQYLFKLRPSFWNDGSPVTAYDFEYAWKKILSPDFKTAFTFAFHPIKNAKGVKEGKIPQDQLGIKVLDDQRLIVELDHPTPYFLQLVAHPLYSPIHQVLDQKYPEWPYQCEKNFPCNGPYQLKMNQPNQGYQLIKNPFYRESHRIVLDQIILTEMNSVQAFQAFQKNEIDWIGNPFGTWHALYNQQKNGQVATFFHNMTSWFVLNTSKPPFHHCKLRQAFAYVIDRSSIMTSIIQPLKPAYSILLAHQHSNTHFPTFDANKAKQFFKEALQELNLKKEDFSPINLIFHEMEIQKQIAFSLKQQFEECFDIDCHLKPLPWNEVFSKMAKGDFQIGLMNWVSVVDDPLYTLMSFKTAKNELNFAKWEDPVYQQLMELSELEINPFQRSSHLREAEEILIREAPTIPLFYPPYQALVSSDLNVNLGSFLNIARSSFKKD